MPDSSLTPLARKNLLYTIRLAVGSDLFRHIYVSRPDKSEMDALDNGRLSCAYVVSGILALHGLIDKPHATVQTTLERLEQAGWRPAKDSSPGAVVVWPPGNDGIPHIGFCIDEQTFMSNSSLERRPVLHGRALSDGREPSGFFVHPSLE